MLLFFLIAKTQNKKDFNTVIKSDKDAVKAISERERRARNLFLINSEINEIIKNRTVGPELQFRLLELYTERLKVIRDEENARYITDVKKNKNLKKEPYFQKSLSEYKKIESFGVNIVNKNPNYIRIGEIYLTLGLNARDFGADMKKSEQFLFEALRKTPSKSPLIYNVQVALAEHFYNKKDFKQAVNYYQEIIKDKNSEWLTKHLFNYAWSLSKVGKLEEALTTLKTSFQLSKYRKDGKKIYADLSEQILYASPYFFLSTKRIEEGVDFISKNAPNPGEFLVAYAYKNLEIGDVKKTKYILDNSRKSTIEKKDLAGEVKTYMAMLDIYRKNNDLNEHFKTLPFIIKVKDYKEFSEDDKKNAISEITDIAGLFQKRVIESVDRDNKKRGSKYSPQNLEVTLKYFDALKILNPVKIDEYTFFQSETLYGALEYVRAMVSYRNTLEFSLKMNPKDKMDLKKKCLNSMLSILGENVLDEKMTYDYSVYSYRSYLTLWPKDKVSESIYPKLFNLYVKHNKYDEANGLIEPFVANFPENQTIQKGMINVIVSEDLKKKNLERVLYWFNKTKTGYLGFDEKFKDNLEASVASLYFEKIEVLEKANKKEEAANEYLKIYANNNFGNKIKSKASFNASGLFLELDQFKKSYEYLSASFKMQSNQEVFSLRDKILLIVRQYYTYQELTLSADLSKMMLERYCKENFKEKEEFFSNSAYIYLIDGKVDQSLNMLKLGESCGVNPKKHNEVVLQNIKEIADIQNIDYLNKYYNIYGKNKNYEIYFIDAYMSMYWYAQEYNELEKVKQIRSVLGPLASSNKKVGDVFNSQAFVDKIKKESFNYFRPNNPFKEEIFQADLDKAFKSLTAYTDEANIKLKLGFPQITLDIYKSLSLGYEKVANDIDAINPENEGPEYVKTFKQAMKPIVNDLRKKAKDFNQIALKASENNMIFTKKNLELKGARETRNKKMIAPTDTQKGINLKGKK